MSAQPQITMVRLQEAVTIITKDGVLTGTVVGSTATEVTVLVSATRYTFPRSSIYRTRYQRLVIDRSK